MADESPVSHTSADQPPPLSGEAKRLREQMPDLPDVPPEALDAAVSWVQMGELCRHYGPAYIIAYSVKALLKSQEADRG